jgi:hypothetical protein
MSLTCEKCGAPLPTSMSACTQCGSPVSPNHLTPSTDPVSAFSSAPSRPEINGLAIVGGFLLLAGVCASVYFAFFFAANVQIPTQEIVGQPYSDHQGAALSLMAQRNTGILFGIGTAIVGFVIAVTARKKQRPA